MKPTRAEPTAAARDPDAKLMLRAKQGEEAAFTQLVNSYQDRLVGVLTHLVQDRQAAEDLAQEVFLKIYKARHGYEPTAKFSTYLFRIANNLASNRRRDVGRKREVTLAGSDSGPMGARPAEQILAETSGMMPARQFARIEIQAVVQDALSTLNDNQRMAVLLHKFEEMSYIDIAATLDTTVSAVKSLLSRARENLRVKLEPYVTQGTWGSQD
ncbi:MAG: sigma-70 family RNA polymerase sigma factor [Planctomycetota bacterium]|nr:sigma-70 family RNA polymerase sigma factor [Planctomycetota bacterium]